MPTPFTEATRARVLKDLGVGDIPPPEFIREELEREWLLPSAGGKKELDGIEWAMYDANHPSAHDQS